MLKRVDTGHLKSGVDELFLIHPAGTFEYRTRIKQAIKNGPLGINNPSLINLSKT
jgi:hypothetical protein